MGKFTAREKEASAKREVGKRRYVYENRVALGKMKREVADREIALMEEIQDDYRAIAEAEEQKGRLL